MPRAGGLEQPLHFNVGTRISQVGFLIRRILFGFRNKSSSIRGLPRAQSNALGQICIVRLRRDIK